MHVSPKFRESPRSKVKGDSYENMQPESVINDEEHTLAH